jgi:hypothetical protein
MTSNEPRAFLTVLDRPHILDEDIGVLENLRCGRLAPNQGELIQLLQRHFNIILSQKFLSDFDCTGVVFLRGSYQSIDEIGLTPILSFDRLGNQTEYVKQLYHHFDDQFDHSSF